ncbi:nuclear transport factor 2 family protein [Hymenobacter cheonanensis]|uniref:nuclear transport factor 2 family protein n=1 Tax=Hymenobacter sp. CA2-7 TaxID=3063993 RepID=UPI002713D2CE|nr:hypothetical protein [Hymenobacter sp. CA2-7]MDO7884300.1 hypothetical protein [Hymenobacter sp. CA2-7]
MKTLLLVIGLLATLRTQAQTIPGNAVRAVEQQVKGYNAHDVNAFLAPYADSIALYSFPDKLLSKGKAAMRQRYASLFSKTPKLHCAVTSRLVELL